MAIMAVRYCQRNIINILSLLKTKKQGFYQTVTKIKIKSTQHQTPINYTVPTNKQANKQKVF